MVLNDIEASVVDKVIEDMAQTVVTVKNIKVKSYLEDFLQLNTSTKREIIASWISGQNEAIAISLDAGIAITIPAFGTFSISAPNVIFKECRNRIAVEYGYNSYADCPKELRVVINNAAKEEQKEVQYARLRDAKILKENKGIKEFNVASDFLRKINL